MLHKKELWELLDSLKFDAFYLKECSKSSYTIDYGAKAGKHIFNGVVDAGEQYIYDQSGSYANFLNTEPKIHFDGNRPILADHELLINCIEIFDWGMVQKSNIQKAISMYRENILSSYLTECKVWFDSASLTDLPSNPVWTSGWTKVYSLISSYTTIYDSRVAAFINFLLIQFCEKLDKEDLSRLVCISSNLFTFGGNNTRVRQLNKTSRNSLCMKTTSTKKDEKYFIANKLSSWFLHYIAKLEFGECASQMQFRTIDKAAFMLGFDCSQVLDQERLARWY